MRVKIILLVFVFFFFNLTKGYTSEVSELKTQINHLQTTINELQKTVTHLNQKVIQLEEKQQSQNQEIIDTPEIFPMGDFSEEKEEQQTILDDMMENVRLGGNLKLYMFDQSKGKRNKQRQGNHLSAGINALYLYLTKTLSEQLTLHVETEVSVSAGATPSIGSDITRATSGSVSTSLHKAYMTLLLPNEYECRVGLFNPLFSEDYAKEIWWDQLYHSNKGLDYLQSWYDSGIELYKNFEFETWSLPTYFYYLNGNSAYRGQFVDNNDEKSILIHIAPELFQSHLRLLGSFAYGKWDNKNRHDLIRYSAGIDWKYKKWTILNEYLSSEWEQKPLTGGGFADAVRDGYQMKCLYRFNPKWRGVLNFSHAELYNSAAKTMRSDIYDTWTVGLNYFITESSTIIGQWSYSEGDRSDESESLDFNRYTLGWRTTF